MGEGPTARLGLRALGLDPGPHFPAQASPSDAYVKAYLKSVEASGIMEHVEWTPAIFDDLEVETAPVS